MKIKVQFFNLYGNDNVFIMMKDDNIIPNQTIDISIDRLLELSKRYDLTLRTRNGNTMAFLACQTTYLPGNCD